MYIKSHTVQFTRKGMKGQVKVQNGRRVHTVKFCGDAEYSWQQWGATEDVLYVSMPLVEKLMNQWLTEYC